MADFRVGIDSYCLNPLGMDPFNMLEWVAEVGGEGVQFSEVHLPPGRAGDDGFLRELAKTADNSRMNLEWAGGAERPLRGLHLASLPSVRGRWALREGRG